MENDHSMPSCECPEKRQLVAALIIRDCRLLIVQNIKNGLRLEPPGGKVEAYERGNGIEGLQQAVRREVMEELGMEITIVQPLGVYSTQSPEGDFDVHMFVCSSADEPVDSREPEKIGGVTWMSMDELRASSALVPNRRSALADIAPLLH